MSRADQQQPRPIDDPTIRYAMGLYDRAMKLPVGSPERDELIDDAIRVTAPLVLD